MGARLRCAQGRAARTLRLRSMEPFGFVGVLVSFMVPRGVRVQAPGGSGVGGLGGFSIARRVGESRLMRGDITVGISNSRCVAGGKK